MKFTLIAGAVILAAGIAQAKVKPIVEWTGELPRQSQEEDEDVLVTSCSQACEGYDLTTLICPEGQKLENCPEDGCSYYHRCVNI